MAVRLPVTDELCVRVPVTLVDRTADPVGVPVLTGVPVFTPVRDGVEVTVLARDFVGVPVTTGDRVTVTVPDLVLVGVAEGGGLCVLVLVDAGVRDRVRLPAGDAVRVTVCAALRLAVLDTAGERLRVRLPVGVPLGVLLCVGVCVRDGVLVSECDAPNDSDAAGEPVAVGEGTEGDTEGVDVPELVVEPLGVRAGVALGGLEVETAGLEVAAALLDGEGDPLAAAVGAGDVVAEEELVIVSQRKSGCAKDY